MDYRIINPEDAENIGHQGLLQEAREAEERAFFAECAVREEIVLQQEHLRHVNPASIQKAQDDAKVLRAEADAYAAASQLPDSDKTEIRHQALMRLVESAERIHAHHTAVTAARRAGSLGTVQHDSILAQAEALHTLWTRMLDQIEGHPVPDRSEPSESVLAQARVDQ